VITAAKWKTCILVVTWVCTLVFIHTHLSCSADQTSTARGACGISE